MYELSRTRSRLSRSFVYGSRTDRVSMPAGKLMGFEGWGCFRRRLWSSSSMYEIARVRESSVFVGPDCPDSCRLGQRLRG